MGCLRTVQSSSHAPARRSTAADAGTTRAAALFILLLALPRIIRLLWPQVWIEDDSYLNGAFLMASGRAPYTTFPLPHFPLLEASLAALLKIFPATIRTAEVFTQAAALAGSILVWRVGRRLGGAVCGAAAALIFATSPLLFRYHVFEREVFLVVPVLAATWLALVPAGAGAPRYRRPAIQGLLLAVAMAIKLTAVSYLGALFIFEAIVARRRGDAIAMLVTACGLMAAATVLLWAIFGPPFLVQVVLFRLAHAGFHTLTGQLREWLGSLDLEFAAGAAGLVLIAGTGRLRQWALPLLHLAFGVVLLVLLNPTFWAHDSIELLPWLALPGGLLVADAWTMFGQANRRAAPPKPLLLTAMAGAVALLVFVTPIRHAQWGPGAASAYGFGYRDRAEIDRAAAAVRAHTSPGEPVAMPPILAFAANRPELIVYPELAGTIMTLQREVDAKGIVTALRTTDVGKRMFWDEVSASQAVWLPQLAQAIERHQVGAVIDFSPADLFPVPLIDVPDDTLRANGYSPVTVTPHYTVWAVADEK